MTRLVCPLKKDPRIASFLVLAATDAWYSDAID
jgi:hypothetical protein